MQYLLDHALDFNKPSFEHIHRSTLKFKKVDAEDELRDIYRLRYKVYCEEKGFEKPEDHPGGIEFDDFDRNSRHFLAASEDRVIGTARLILSSEKDFPVEKHCRIETDLSLLDRSRLGEISRLAVSKEYGRVSKDQDLTFGTRRQQMIVFGLYKIIYVESKKMGFTHWLAVMSDGLHQLLKKIGVVFTPIGPSVNYHGIRTPYLGSIAEIEAGVSRVNPELFKEASEELRRHFKYSLAV